MNRVDIDYVQSSIGYQFKNLKLLEQAFTRKSYSAEHPEVQDNEVLEFYGDAALNFYITQAMSNSFGKIQNRQFISEKDEGELSDIRSRNVNKQKLSHCIKILGLEKYLILGTADIKNKVWESDSVREDLFESIVGAVTIDSGWKFSAIKRACENLFSISDFEENYLELLEEECKKRGWEPPHIWDENLFARMYLNNFSYHSLYQYPYFEEASNIPHLENCYVEIRNLRENVTDYNSAPDCTKTKSIMLSARLYYEWLLRRDKIKKVVETANEDFAVNQLHELYQKKLIGEPTYSFAESHDKDGNPIWKCSCKLSEAEYPFEAENSSKKKVKQQAAFQALDYLLGSEISLNRDMEGR